MRNFLNFNLAPQGGNWHTISIGLKALSAIFLILGFALSLYRIKRTRVVKNYLKQTVDKTTAAARERALANRVRLQKSEQENSLKNKIEHLIYYTGIGVKYPHFTTEYLILMNIVAAVLLSVTCVFGIKTYLILLCTCLIAEVLTMETLRAASYRRVNRDLMKFLDFLGNFSITNGEITAAMGQVAPFLEDPLKTALTNCYFEAQTTGDAQMALLTLADRIEHPEFKAIIRSLEIGIRYSADINSLIDNSRKSANDFLHHSTQIKAMLKESAVNMALLLSMSFLALFIVDKMLLTSVWDIVFGTMLGKTAIAIIVAVVVLFLGKLRKEGE